MGECVLSRRKRVFSNPLFVRRSAVATAHATILTRNAIKNHSSQSHAVSDD